MKSLKDRTKGEILVSLAIIIITTFIWSAYYSSHSNSAKQQKCIDNVYSLDKQSPQSSSPTIDAESIAICKYEYPTQ